jgi:hypothetical protein
MLLGNWTRRCVLAMLCASCLGLASDRLLAQQQNDESLPWRVQNVPTSFGFLGLNQESPAPIADSCSPQCRDFRQPIAQLKNAIFQQGWLNHPERHVGKGEPLVGTSWLNRPLHVDWFYGQMWPSDLISGRVKQQSDGFGGYRFGRDVDHYWGWETRLGFAKFWATDNTNALLTKGSSLLLWDGELLYYPWGDAKWRPFALWGLGVANWRFNDELDQNYKSFLVHMPLGIGAKYQCRKWLAMRLDLIDNISFAGSGVSAMHNVSLTFGVEVHFGGWRRSYYPWNPARHLH